MWMACSVRPVALGAGPALAETDAPVTLDRREGPKVAAELRVHMEPGPGTPIPHAAAIQWRRRVEVRVRAVPGLPLTEEERGEHRELALTCGETGHDDDLFEYVGADNTAVLGFDCQRGEPGRETCISRSSTSAASWRRRTTPAWPSSWRRSTG
jgi:hypothetical protein